MDEESEMMKIKLQCMLENTTNMRYEHEDLRGRIHDALERARLSLVCIQDLDTQLVDMRIAVRTAMNNLDEHRNAQNAMENMMMDRQEIHDDPNDEERAGEISVDGQEAGEHQQIDIRMDTVDEHIFMQHAMESLIIDSQETREVPHDSEAAGEVSDEFSDVDQQTLDMRTALHAVDEHLHMQRAMENLISGDSEEAAEEQGDTQEADEQQQLDIGIAMRTAMNILDEHLYLRRAIENIIIGRQETCKVPSAEEEVGEVLCGQETDNQQEIATESEADTNAVVVIKIDKNMESSMTAKNEDNAKAKDKEERNNQNTIGRKADDENKNEDKNNKEVDNVLEM